MPKVTYHLPDGTQTTVDVAVGQSLMDAAVRNNLPGIVAECGGGCACATCHVRLDPAARDLFTAATDEEISLVEYLDDAAEDSRLSCQLIAEETDRPIDVHVMDSR